MRGRGDVPSDSDDQGPPARPAPGRATLAERIARKPSGGAPLPDGPRASFEASLGADLGGVRVHTGAESAGSARELGARAYAVGNDIHVGDGQYAPGDPFGIHLLAHEVAHTQQQAGSRVQAKLETSAPGDAAEVEADRAADAMIRGQRASVSAAGAAVMRAPGDPGPAPTEPMKVELQGLTTVAQSNMWAGKVAIGHRAVAFVPPGLPLDQPVEVLVLLSGENTDWSSQIELARSKVAATMQALNRRLIALLPQGTPASQFGSQSTPGDQFKGSVLPGRPSNAPDAPHGAIPQSEDRGFDTEAFIVEALGKLVPSPLAKLPPRGKTILAGHSEGGHAATTIMTGEGRSRPPANLGEVILFDGINADSGASLARVEEWLATQFAHDRGELQRAATPQAQLAYLATSMRFRNITTSGLGQYEDRNTALTDFLLRFFSAQAGAFAPEVVLAWSQNYKVERSTARTHGGLVGGGLAQGLGALPPPGSAAPAPQPQPAQPGTGPSQPRPRVNALVPGEIGAVNGAVGGTLDDVTNLLAAPVIDAARVVAILRGLTALLTFPNDPAARAEDPSIAKDATVKAIDGSRLPGDARWRARNLRIWGAEDRWPPILRNDTFAIITEARGKIGVGQEKAVADGLRPLDASARHQTLQWWRSQRQGGMDEKFFDRVAAELVGPSFAPDPAAPTDAPILDLEAKGEQLIYTYFRDVVFPARGFAFYETPDDPKADVVYQVINIRGHDLTKSSVQRDKARLDVTTMNGHLYVLWKDDAGTKLHVDKGWDWSTTGGGVSKQNGVAAAGQNELAKAGMAATDWKAKGGASAASSQALAALPDAQAALGEAAHRADLAKDEAKWAAALAMSANPQGTGDAATARRQQGEARGAVDSAINAHRLCTEAEAAAKEAEKRLGTGATSDDQQKLAALRATLAWSDRTATDAWTTARDGYLVLTRQIASREEEELLAAWKALPDGKDKEDAYVAYQAKRKANERALNEEMAIPWIDEGEYRAARVGPTRNKTGGWDFDGQQYFHINSGISTGVGGVVPAARDWSGDGTASAGEAGTTASAVGTGVQMHPGDGAAASIGCNVGSRQPDASGQVPYTSLIKRLGGNRSGNPKGAPAASFTYIVVEATHLPPWPF
jgi:Domain of unknown function (DUF4157)